MDDCLDDENWIEVVDETFEESFDDSASFGSIVPESLSLKAGTVDKSFQISGNGSFRFDAFEKPIKKTGIRSSSFGGDQKSLPQEHLESRLKLIEEVGRGSFSTVFRAIDSVTLQTCAVKKIAISKNEQRRHFIQELSTLYETRNSNCPNLLTFIEAFSFSNEFSVGLVFEYMDCSLMDLTKACNGINDEFSLAYISRECLRGLKYLHEERRVIHRDVKPNNILLSSKGPKVKLSDFGLAKVIPSELTRASTFVGTMNYMCPERIEGETYSFTSDLYSLGVTVATTALGKSERRSSYWDTLKIGSKTSRDPFPLSDDRWSENIRGFISLCLQVDPADRPNARDLLKHEFISDGAVNGRERVETMIQANIPVKEVPMKYIQHKEVEIPKSCLENKYDNLDLRIVG